MSTLKTLLMVLVEVAICSVASLAPLHAHPFHTTTAEMEYNAESGKFEVTLKVPASDLEEALTRQAALGAKADSQAVDSQAVGAQAAGHGGRHPRVTLDKTPEVERLIIAYLKAHFFLNSADHHPTVNATAARDTAAVDTTENSVAEAPNTNAADERAPQASGSAADSAEHRSRLHWLGMELDKSSAWLYFELEASPDDRLSLRNELFFELNAQQINTCTLRMAAAKFSMRTDAHHPQVALPPQARSG